MSLPPQRGHISELFSATVGASFPDSSDEDGAGRSGASAVMAGAVSEMVSATAVSTSEFSEVTAGMSFLPVIARMVSMCCDFVSASTCE